MIRAWADLFRRSRPPQAKPAKDRAKDTAPAASLERRTVYVNMELPADVQDDYGQPTRIFISNKIQTAKYTWYTFLPKNLFEQFRGIANLYFLFLVILQMFPLFSTTASPIVVVLPLAAILILTGAKDAIEDHKRNATDESVNKAITYTLTAYKNVNVPVYKVARWRRWLHSIKNVLSGAGTVHDHGPPILTFSAQPAKETLPTATLPSVPTPSSLGSSFRQTIRSSTTSLTRVFKKRKMPYRPGQVPHSVLRRSTLSTKTTTHPVEAQELDEISQPQQHLDRTLDPRWRQTRWQDIAVGDFVMLQNNDAVPADLVVLSSSEPDGLCYVETQNLDGESNLKIKRSLQATNEINTPEDCDKSKFYVESEAPHANLYSFNGVLKWKVEVERASENDDRLASKDQKLRPPSQFDSMDSMSTAAVNEDVMHDNEDEDDEYAVSHEKTEAITGGSLLLRGCVLRNTGWVIGLVLFTGTETKIMLNSGKTPSKRSKMEKATNPHVIANFVLLFLLCLVCSIAASIMYSAHSSAIYFEHINSETAIMEGFLMFWTTLVIYQNIIPISLYISVQIVKTAAAYFIHTDIDMYDEKLDQPCIPKTWNISDDLGQIEYLFSDKTGTLTQNIMEFRKCTINGVAYGLGETEAALGAKLREIDQSAASSLHTTHMDYEKARTVMMQKQAELFQHNYTNPNSPFVDPQIYVDLAQDNAQSQSIVHFFSALALCHTVIPEVPDPDAPYTIEYKAQSPDDAALVATARDIGFTFVMREQDTVWIDAMGEQRAMVLLNVLEFNSSRKRMSVIMRSPQDGQIVLLCKGADSVIYERLSTETSEEQSRVRAQTLKDLSVFANEGLRTLCIASRILAEDEYTAWAANYKTASSSIHNRDEQIEQVCDTIERSLTLIGGTAIEDKLQEGVPDTIAVLAKAGIKIWVLTGDKVETAINIGFACNLLTKDMLLISVNARDAEDTLAQLHRSQLEVDEKAKRQRCALVIDGESLKYALEPACSEKFLALGIKCMAVICCRVSPMQKAKVVRLVKKGLKVMTLAIGDGANDVSMIQEANVGVGISGEEGRQAVMASDYAIAQFRYLSKLLLVHGRWSYLRTSEMILTFFYKNIMWTLVLFWYQIFCSFSGTMMFDYSYITLYNLVFTSLPCIFAGVLDQDLKSGYSFKFPQLYLMGIRNDKFKRSRFYWTVLDAVYQSAVCFGVPYLVFVGGKMSSSGYDTEGVYELGTFIAGIAVVVANALVGFTIFSWTWVMVMVIVLSSATFFLWTGVYAQIITFTFYGEDMLFREGVFWLCLVITFVICMFPRFVTKYCLHMHWPFDNDIIRELVLCKPRHWRREAETDEEAIPITLARAQSEQSVVTEHMMQTGLGDIDPVEHAYASGRQHLLRRTTDVSGKSEIMNMRSGKRTSFTGFAFSSDDASVFDEFRKSVYCHQRGRGLQRSGLFRNSTLHISTLASRRKSTINEDWMPIQGFRLKRFETAPESASPNKTTGLGWKMVTAVKQRMSTSRSPSSRHITPTSTTSDLVELASSDLTDPAGPNSTSSATGQAHVGTSSANLSR